FEDGLRQALPEHAALAVGAALNRLEQSVRLHAGLDSQREYFGQRDVGAKADRVVAQFGDLARADVTDVADLVANRQHARPDPLVDGLVAPHHHLERGLLGPARSAADRGIEDADAVLGELLVSPPDQGGRAGREIGVDRAAGRALQDAALAQGDLLDLLGARQ